MNSNRIPASHLWQSFLKIAAGYVAVVTSMICTFVAIAMFGFPESFRLLTEQKLTEDELRNRIGEILPVELFWIVAGVGALTAFASGWWIARSRGIASSAHVVFLAMVLFVSGMQVAIGAQPEVRWMPWVLAGLLPISALMGAKIGLRSSDLNGNGEVGFDENDRVNG